MNDVEGLNMITKERIKEAVSTIARSFGGRSSICGT
jgi:hypothetical protein